MLIITKSTKCSKQYSKDVWKHVCFKIGFFNPSKLFMYRNSSNEKTHFYILGVWEYWVTNMQCVVQNITKFIEKLKEEPALLKKYKTLARTKKLWPNRKL
jgi:hypothetical protein